MLLQVIGDEGWACADLPEGQREGGRGGEEKEGEGEGLMSFFTEINWTTWEIKWNIWLILLALNRVEYG